MISIENIPNNTQSRDSDFTIENYHELLVIAKKNYKFASFAEIPWGERFLLWRHDCDFSLNRSYALAKIEADEGVHATYFLNPHSEFYNLQESSQHRLVHEIMGMGHQIGLHFDAAFYDIQDEESLSNYIQIEACFLGMLFGVEPKVFSFHNPVASHMQCENDAYGGLVNCYSKRLRSEVSYCSDSNGYWRFKCLHDVLNQATDRCLQVLTHPDWWQEREMPPRQRVFRSVYGRAQAIMKGYDDSLHHNERENHLGFAKVISFMKTIDPELYIFLDMLWMSEKFETLFIELWRLHEKQLNKISKAALNKQWCVPSHDLEDFFDRIGSSLDAWCLFFRVFGKTWQCATDIKVDNYMDWLMLRNKISRGISDAQDSLLEEGCVVLSQAIEGLIAWAKVQDINYDGMSSPGMVVRPKHKTGNVELTKEETCIDREKHDFSYEHWCQFKVDMENMKNTKLTP